MIPKSVMTTASFIQKSIKSWGTWLGQQFKRVNRIAALTSDAIQRQDGLRSVLKKAIQLYRYEGLAGIMHRFRIFAVLFRIESIHKQIYPCRGLCIADDPTTDKTIRPILEIYTKEDTRIKNKVKIISGHSEKGGSTTAFINLTNFFNKNGIDCTFYGPHTYHLDKCKSDMLNNLTFDKGDIIISHYLKFDKRPNVKKVILSCHEKWWFRLAEIKQYWDVAVFLHYRHREYHRDYKGESTIIPNLKENLVHSNKEGFDKIAGIVGSIEDRKQTHISIQRALNDGCEKIYLFGHIGEQDYYENNVKPLLDDKVILKGHTLNKQQMYDSIGRVYHSSKGEVACLVKDECYLTSTKFFGNSETENEVSTLTNDEVLTLWGNLFNIAQPVYSLILTVHNKGFLLKDSLERLKIFTKGNYELIVVLDGCSDDSEQVLLKFIKLNPKIKIKIKYSDDVFETKANNIGLKEAESEYVIIIQDDMLINEGNWNTRLTHPFRRFNDVFAVSANCSHNWKFNRNSKHLNMVEDLDNCWCDIISHVDHAGKHWGLSRDIFAVRQCVNRGPLAINHSDLITMNYFDEKFAPQDMDDHDLCFRMMKQLGKVVGCYWIDFISDFSWGGTRENGRHKPWLLKANHKNMKLVWERHSDLIRTTRKNESRNLKF